MWVTITIKGNVRWNGYWFVLYGSGRDLFAIISENGNVDNFSARFCYTNTFSLKKVWQTVGLSNFHLCLRFLLNLKYLFITFTFTIEKAFQRWLSFLYFFGGSAEHLSDFRNDRIWAKKDFDGFLNNSESEHNISRFTPICLVNKQSNGLKKFDSKSFDIQEFLCSS